jgi:hypothetical protein
MVVCREPSARANESSIIASKLGIWHYVHLVVVFFPSQLTSHHKVRHSGIRLRRRIQNDRLFSWMPDHGNTVSGMTTVATSGLL